MSEKKMVSRNVAIALGIICIILIGLIAYFSVIGISAQNSYNNLQNQNKQLQTWLDGNETLLNQTQANNTNLQNQIDSRNSNVTNLLYQLSSLNSTVIDLQNITNLKEHWIWEGGELIQYKANTYGEWASNPDYAGYIRVDVNSTSSNTYVRVFYHSLSGVNYDNQVAVGAGITHTFFPVLPALDITIRVGNTNSVDAALIGVTITYFY